MLADGRPFLAGEAFTIADAYLYVMTTWCRPTGIDLARWPAVSAFAKRVGDRPSVQAALAAEGVKAAA